MFHIPDKKPICQSPLPAERDDDSVLRRIDVLVFIHEHETKPLSPLQRGFARRIHFQVPQQPQRILFEIMEIHYAQLTFGLGKCVCESPGQLEQRAHLWTHPIPIFGQGVHFPGNRRK